MSFNVTLSMPLLLAKFTPKSGKFSVENGQSSWSAILVFLPGEAQNTPRGLDQSAAEHHPSSANQEAGNHRKI